MESFSRHDFRAALDFIALLGEAGDLDEFASHIAFEFDGVIGCHCSSYNEINPRRRRAHWIASVETGLADVQAFEQHIAENPLINHVGAHPLGPAVRISDLVSQRQWRSLGVYSDFYHPWNCERIMSLEIATGAVSISVAVFGDGRDFSERDRTMMTVLRPHLIGAYRHAALIGDLGERLALLDRGIEIGGLGVVVVGANGRVRSMSDAARVWLAAYFGPLPGHDCLPDAVTAWLRRGESPASAAETMPQAPLPFVAERDDARLVLRCLRHAGQSLILLHEERTTITAGDLAALGLARREAEILAWVALGKTDAEVAAILAISPRTVSHTLERVYRKLGVESRLAASMRALGVLRAGRRTLSA
jgi:DNA-binding CsgD family transcriptional regulator